MKKCGVDKVRNGRVAGVVVWRRGRLDYYESPLAAEAVIVIAVLVGLSDSEWHACALLERSSRPLCWWRRAQGTEGK